MNFFSKLPGFLLLGLLFGLPFEFYFRSREQTLYTSLKVQFLVFLAAWLLSQGVRYARRTGVEPRGPALKPETPLLSKRLVLAALALASSQVLAAALAPELRGNSARAGYKTVLAVLILIAAADTARAWMSRGGSSSALLHWAMIVLSASGTISSVLGLGEMAGLDACKRIVDLFQPNRFFAQGHMRFSSTMEYPNTAGSIVAACFLAALVLVVFSKGPFGKTLRSVATLLVTLVLGIALLLTFSRGSVISVAVALALLPWMLRLPAIRLGWRLAILGALALVMVTENFLAILPEPALTDNKRRVGQRIARFGLTPNEEIRYLEPGREYLDRVRVRNDSALPWKRRGFGIAYRWHGLDAQETSRLIPGSAFSDDVARGQEQEVEVRIRAPYDEGEYLLIWFVFHRDPAPQELERSFSPAVICVVRPLSAGRTPLSDTAAGYLKNIIDERNNLHSVQVPTRSELWQAAVKMWLGRPLAGIGPDNFRLLKWKFMAIPKGDATIHANSLYLEFLAGSGILGLASLLWFLWECGSCLALRWRGAQSLESQAMAGFGLMYFVAFLVHGVVDYFLKFTPTFLLFWIVMGLTCANVEEPSDVDSNRF